MLVCVALRVDVLQQLDLVQTLVKEVLAVLDDLEADPLGLVGLRQEVHALKSRGERGLTTDKVTGKLVHRLAKRRRVGVKPR